MTDNSRKVVTKDGRVGRVMGILGADRVSVQTEKDGFYRVYHVSELEDIREEEFKSRFK